MRLESSYYKNQYTRWKKKLQSGRINQRQFEDWCGFHRSYAREVNVDFIPPTLSLTLTKGCNLHCPTCQLLPFRETSRTVSMTLDFVQEIFKRAPHSFSSIIIAGGEPLLTPHFREIIHFLVNLNREIKLYSNGILLTRYAQDLRGVRKINISLDSFDEDSFRKNRGGTAAQYRSILDGLAKLIEHGIPFQLSYVLHHDNLDEGLLFLDFAERASAASVKFHNINAYYSSQHKPVTLPDRRTEEFLKKIMDRNNYSFDITLPTILNSEDNQSQLVACAQLWDGVRVGPDGSLALCCHTDNNPCYGNIFDANLLNSTEFIEWRMRHIQGRLGGTICEFCPQRFFAEDYAFFHVHSGQWEFNNVHFGTELHLP